MIKFSIKTKIYKLFLMGLITVQEVNNYMDFYLNKMNVGL
jgi:hypothetical protein